MPDPSTDSQPQNGGLRPDQIDPAYGAITRGLVYSGNPLLTAQPPAPAPAPVGYTRPQSTYSSPFAPPGQTPQVVSRPYWNTNLPPTPPAVQGSGTTTSSDVPPSGAGSAGAATSDGLLLTPNLATTGRWPVDWSDESLPFKERYDDMLRHMPANLRPGVQVEDAYRTEEQQRQLYDDPTAGGPGHVVARPGPNAPHVKGIAADLKFVGPMGPAAEQWVRANAHDYELGFPLANDPNHMQLAENIDKTKYDVSLLQRTMYRLESDDGRDPKTKVAFDPNNPDAPVGPAQIKMETFREFARPNEDINNPQQNLDVGYRALAEYYKRYGGDMDKALIAYNAGPDKVNLPRNQLKPETQAYLDKAHKLWNDGAAIAVLNGTRAPSGGSDAQARADALAQQRISTLQAGLDALTKRINAADPTSTEVLDMLRQNQAHVARLQQVLEEKISKAPQPQDYQTNMFGKFGSLATIIGIFGGLLSRAPLTASLGAAAGAMEAINQGDYDRYKDQFKLWDTQVGMVSTALQLQHSTYSEILQTAQWNDREKWERIHEAASLFNDQATLLALEQGNAQEIADRPFKLQKQQLDLEHIRSQNREIDAKAAKEAEEAGLGREYGSELAKDTDQHAIARGIVDKKYEDYVKSVPAGTAPVSRAVFAKGAAPDALVEAHQRLYPKAADKDLYQVTWDDRPPQIVSKVGGQFLTPDDRPVDMSGATSITPITRAVASQRAAAAAVKPSTVQYWVRVLQAGGHLLPGLGRGAEGQATVRAIQDAMGESGVPPEEFISRQMTVKANQTSLTNMTRMADASTAFENTAIRNFDQALALAPKVIPTDWPWLNRWVETGQTQFGDIETPAYVTALLTAANEYAKVMTGATGAQGSTVDARREAAEFFSPYLNKGQINRVVEIAKSEMENRKNANYDMVKEITSRIGGGATTGTAAPQAPARPTNVPSGSAWSASRKQWRDPDGKLYDEQGKPL